MMKFLRSQSQTVLVVILVVIGGSFLFYGNVGSLLTGGERGGSNDYGRIGGQDVSVAELYDAVRTTRDSWILSGRASELSQTGGHAQLAEEAWRQLLLLHEADRLHIDLSDREISDYIRNQPIFQKDGVYSPDLYQSQMASLENTAHISADAFEKVVRQNLLAQAVIQALFSTVHAPPAQVTAEFAKFYGPVQLSTITFDPKTFAATVAVAPTDIEAEYKAHPDNPAYRTPEKRKVDYVLLPLSPNQAKLPDKEKAAIEALGEKALEFALALQPEPSPDTNSTPPPAPDFLAEAKKDGLNPVTTDFFTADTPPAGLPPSPAFNNAAFSLTQDSPVSKVVELDNGVAVLHLAGVQPSELRPLDEVKDEIDRQLRQSRAGEAAQAAAGKAAQDLRTALARGTDFKTAAAALKLDVQSIPAFVPEKAPRTDQRLETLAYVSTSLNVGDVSPPFPMESDGSLMLIHLDSRGPAIKADEDQYEAHFREVQDARLSNLVYLDWATWKDRQPGTHPPPNLDEYGGVE
jgi:peptidyl-prolyl cis-trans isomerase D